MPAEANPEPRRRWPDEAAQVVVVGGTSGIGAAIARRFGAVRRTLAVGLDTAPDAAGAVRQLELDVTADTALEELLGATPQLEVLVNAAGIIRRDAEYDPAVFAQVIDINLTAAMRACVTARPALAANRGCIVNIASMLSYFGGPRVPAYAASKGAVVQLTRSLAVAWAGEGIRVNAVAPGWITTNLTAGLQADPAASARILDRTPMRRWGTPDEVADVVDFLASAAARFVTGAVIPVDGGYSAA